MASVIDGDIDTLLELAERAADELEMFEDAGDSSFALAENIRTVVARIKRIRSENDGGKRHEETKEVNREYPNG